jgi:20S proteasome subunit alpha 6
MAIGARSQASKTYLEKSFETFPDASLDDLCRHALLALREACAEGELTEKNVSLAFVGKATRFAIVADLKPYLDAVKGAEGEQAVAAEMPDALPAAEEAQAEPMAEG